MIVTRFAPSPTGRLHLGHALAALTAAEAGARFLLRIEDIDTARCREEFVDGIFEDLRWLGLSWEEPVLRQSQRFDAYRGALEKLESRGLVYPCFCTRKEIAEEIARAGEAPHGPDGVLYPGTCRHLSQKDRAARMASGIGYALRLDARAAADITGPLAFREKEETVAVQPLLFGDVVLARKDTPVSYHMAVVIDDAFQGVTLVTRGGDLAPATHIQRLLQALLDVPAPFYAHHRLILDGNRRKFSKRDNAITLAALREGGAKPVDILRRICFR